MAPRTPARTAPRTGAVPLAGGLAVVCFATAIAWASHATAQPEHGGHGRPDFQPELERAPGRTESTRERPPLASSGGFGEPSCHTCHFDYPLNQPDASASITGLPDRGYQPGTVYLLRIDLGRPGLRAAGFQLTARFEDGTQAGRLDIGADEISRAAIDSLEHVLYAFHLYDGTHPVARDSARWTIRWTAPDAGRPVTFHLATNAADGDDSALGDIVITSSRTTPAASARVPVRKRP